MKATGIVRRIDDLLSQEERSEALKTRGSADFCPTTSIPQSVM